MRPATTYLFSVPVSIVVIIFSLALALSEDFLGICGATLQLWWAKILQKAGLFGSWKKKGDSVRKAIATRQKKLNELYNEEVLSKESISLV